MVAAEDKKELIERLGFAIIARLIYIALIITINGAIIIYIGYLFYKDTYQNNPNYYVWIVCFFSSQFLGFFLFDILIILLMTSCVVKCCKKKKVCLARIMRESLYIYEDY